MGQQYIGKSNKNYWDDEQLSNKLGINVSFICKRIYPTTLLKEFGVTGTPNKAYELISDYNNKAYELISDYNNNILINSIVNEVKQHFRCLFQKYESLSNTILDTKNGEITN